MESSSEMAHSFKKEKDEPIISKDKLLKHAHMVYDTRSVSSYDPDELEVYTHELEELPEVKGYRTQQVRLDTFDEIILLAESNNLENNEELNSLLAHMRKISESIKAGVQQYYNVVLEYQYHSSRGRAGDIEAYQHTKMDLEKRRTASHNSLMSNLVAFTRVCNTKLKDFGIEVPADKLFNKVQLEDRNFIGAWAFSSEEARRIEEVIKLEKNIIKK